MEKTVSLSIVPVDEREEFLRKMFDFPSLKHLASLCRLPTDNENVKPEEIIKEILSLDAKQVKFEEKLLKEWETKKADQIKKLFHFHSFKSSDLFSFASFTPDKKFIVACDDSCIVVWDASTQKMVTNKKWSLDGHFKYAKFTKDNHFIFFTGQMIHCYSIPKCQEIWANFPYSEFFYLQDGMDINEKHGIIAIGTDVSQVRFARLKDGEAALQPLDDETEGFYAGIAFIGGNKLLTANNHGSIKIWDFQKRIILDEINLTEKIFKFVVSPNKEIYFTRSPKFITFYDPNFKKISKFDIGRPFSSPDVKFSSNGKFIAVNSLDDECIRFYDIQKGEVIHKLEKMMRVFYWKDNLFIFGVEGDTVQIWKQGE